MNTDYLSNYMTIDGQVKPRPLVERQSKIVFAGFKYAFDRIASILGLILLSPFMLIIAILIKLDSEGPVFFKQRRTGKHGKDFYVYKFRTMVANNDVHDFSKQDEFTKVGKFIRRLSLDEIPQLINIAKGEMSFIGPRPWIPDYYENMNEEQRQRFVVRPGLTGLAQVRGRNSITIFDKIKNDIEYINNYSLIQDLSIVIDTIKIIFSGRGADAGKQTIQQEINALKKQNNYKLKVSK